MFHLTFSLDTPETGDFKVEKIIPYRVWRGSYCFGAKNMNYQRAGVADGGRRWQQTDTTAR